MKKLLIAIALFIASPAFANSPIETKSSGQALIGGEFSLTDQNGKKVNSSDFRGKQMLVYFGFTSCMDICPTDLALITDVINKLGDKANIAPIFITVDPERDTVEQMKKYMENFSPKIIALTGTKEETNAVASAYRVYHKKAQSESTNGYNVDHSGFIYLMDKDGNYLAHFSHEQSAEEIASKIAAQN